MAEKVNPGSFVGDSIEEFKKLPTWGKILSVGVLLVVAYIAYNAYQSNKTSSSAPASATSTGTTTGSQSPFASVGGLPLLPSNVNPVFDSGGNPIAYQQSPASNPTTPTSSTQSGVPGVNYGLIPFGQFNYKNSMAGKQYVYQGTSYTIKPGSAGHIYGQTNAGQSVLLYAPASYYPGGSNYKAPGGTGSGPSTSNLMQDPMVYLQSATPHISSSVPQ
jgi:hypothetical protein